MKSTCDISDEMHPNVQYLKPVFQSFGKKTRFSGRIVTIECFEDNSLVEEALRSDGSECVLVIDAGASLNCAMMGDKRALQAGTSHNLGQNFAKAFGVTFQDRENKEEHVYATSWGVSTRLVGGVVMAHGDDNGLVLPPKIAPIQVIVIPIAKTDEDKKTIMNHVDNIVSQCLEKGIRVKVDNSNNSPGFKFNEWELKGVPIRLEIGLRDISKKEVILARRDIEEKQSVKLNKLVKSIHNLLDEIQNNILLKATNFRDKNTFRVNSYKEFKNTISNTGGFIRCGWDGTIETETAIKNETKATIRCIPLNSNPKDLKCIYSGEDAIHEVIFAKAY